MLVREHAGAEPLARAPRPWCAEGSSTPSPVPVPDLGRANQEGHGLGGHGHPHTLVEVYLAEGVVESTDAPRWSITWNFQNGPTLQVGTPERSDVVSLLPGLGTHRLQVNLECAVVAGVPAETFPLIHVAGELHCINHRGHDRWVGMFSPAMVVVRPPVSTHIHDLAVSLDDAAVLALDEAIDGHDFQLRVDSRVDLIGAPGWPRSEEQALLQVHASTWQRQLQGLSRTVSLTGSIPIRMTTGPLAVAGEHLRNAEHKLVAGEWLEAVRLTRLAQEQMRKSALLPAPSKKGLDQQTLAEKYANLLRSVFELASVPQHNGVAQADPFGRTEAYVFFWTTSAAFYKMCDLVQP